MKDEVKGEQGLAALAWGKFEDEYEIEGIRQIFEKEGDFSPVYKQLIKYIGRRFLHYRSVIGSSTVRQRSVTGSFTLDDIVQEAALVNFVERFSVDFEH